ncbi:hypothetical protein AMBLS11_11965 [Alteromonas macleodii str. 'Black Sea 11']|nr:hypothetical protein AMBLS11_11965 [Alteromonas macleodii str. 'Black Sea 11']|tara:strand:- start:1570 stop:1800 length:231 start_codon:yes stop_codon:yes gene_type:complete
MLSMSELEAHQTIYLILGFASGACLASFFLTSNPFFVIVNFVLLNKIMFGVKSFYSEEKERENGRKLLTRALFRFF